VPHFFGEGYMLGPGLPSTMVRTRRERP